METQLASRVSAYVLAGGRGERLHPLTEVRAKPLVSFGGSYRLIDFTLSNAFNSGLQRLHVLTQYRSAALHEHVANVTSHAGKHGYTGSVTCVSPVAGGAYAGTADAVFQNLARLVDPDGFALVLSSDHVYAMDYRELIRFHAEQGGGMTVAAVEYPAAAATQFGVIEADAQGRVIGFEEKPSVPKTLRSRPSRALVNMGVYIFDVSVLRRSLLATRTVGGQDFGRHVIPWLVRHEKVSVYNFTEQNAELGSYWQDVGTVDSYYACHMELLSNGGFDVCDSVSWLLHSGNPVPLRVDNGWIQNAIIPKTVEIESDALVANSVFAPRVRVGRRAQVRDSILGPGVRIGRGARIYSAIIDENVWIPDGMTVGGDLGVDHRSSIRTKAGIVVVPANAKLEEQFVSCAPFERTRVASRVVVHRKARAGV